MQFLERFKRQFVLLQVSDIPVRADGRWLFFIALMSTIIAATIQPFVANLAASIVFALATTIVFFVSIFVHEFAHAAIARIERLEVVEIVLHPFGGLTRFRHEPETPRAEFRIAIAGPAASFVLALIFVLAAVAFSSAGAEVLAVLMFTLAIGNFLIAVFNMFPGYPLDGGRVLRAYLWRSGRDLNEATILTGRFGQGIAVVMFVFGLAIILVRNDFFTGFWAILVGLFLFDSAGAIIREIRSLEQIFVEDVMMLPIAVAPGSTIREFVDNVLPMNRLSVFPVAENRQLYGMLLLSEIKLIEKSKWHLTVVRDVMQPVEDQHFVETGVSIAEAREIIRSNGIGTVGVVDSEGQLVGMVHLGISR